jgi:hypothetical protein
MRDPRFRLDGETLALYGSLRECPESMDELTALARRFAGRSLFDPGLISDIKAAFGESVWIKRIVSLRRSFPNRIEIEYLLRLPAAQVWHDSRFWLVDAGGMLLPAEPSRTPAGDLPEIVGITADVFRGRPAPGSVWNDEGVAGALGVIRAFWGSTLSEALPVGKVLVSAGTFRSGGRDMEKRRRFDVVSTGGVVIRWGTYNPGYAGGEPTSAEKLRALQELLASPEVAPGVALDVRTRLPGFFLID